MGVGNCVGWGGGMGVGGEGTLVCLDLDFLEPLDFFEGPLVCLDFLGPLVDLSPRDRTSGWSFQCRCPLWASTGSMVTKIQRRMVLRSFIMFDL